MELLCRPAAGVIPVTCRHRSMMRWRRLTEFIKGCRLYRGMGAALRLRTSGVVQARARSYAKGCLDGSGATSVGSIWKDLETLNLELMTGFMAAE